MCIYTTENLKPCFRYKRLITEREFRIKTNIRNLLTMDVTRLRAVYVKNRIYILSIAIGLAVGIITVPYRYVLMKSVLVRDYLFYPGRPLYFHLLILAGMWGVAMLIYLSIKKFPMIEGSGIPQVEGYLCSRFPAVNNFKQMVLKLFGSIAGIGMGLSLGREGPSVQAGAFIANMVGKWSRVNPFEQRFLTSGGAAAGLSAVFTAPLASTIFVNEEISKYQSPRISVTALLATVTSGWIAKAVFMGNEYSSISHAAPSSGELYLLLPVIIVLALFMAFSGKVFNYLLLLFKDRYKNSKLPAPLRIFGVTLLIFILGLFIPDLVAGGEPAIFKYSAPGGALWWILILFLIKLIITPLCYALGFPGGIFLPLLVIGALGGKLFLLVLCSFGMPYEAYSGFFMLISMAAIFAASVRSPITGLILILEITGQFTMFFPMIVLVGLTFFFSEIMNVKPIYDSLYERLLPKNYADEDKTVSGFYGVCPGSYVAGKTIKELTLPDGSRIVAFERDGKLSGDMEIPLLPGDLIEVRLRSKYLEPLHRALRSLCNE